MCPINRIESDTALKPLEWYQSELNKAYKDLKIYYQQYYQAVKDYNLAMSKNFSLAYRLSKVNGFTDKLTATKKYKEDYENVKNAYLLCGDIYTKILCTKEVIDTLKKERAENYGELRKQSN